jgi:hypothetical protein
VKQRIVGDVSKIVCRHHLWIPLDEAFPHGLCHGLVGVSTAGSSRVDGDDRCADVCPPTGIGFAGRNAQLRGVEIRLADKCEKASPGPQQPLGSDRFEVMALAVDRTGADIAKKFLDGIKIESLKLYVDTSARSGSTLKTPRLPTTILVGPAKWNSADAKRLIDAVL